MLESDQKSLGSGLATWASGHGVGHHISPRGTQTSALMPMDKASKSLQLNNEDSILRELLGGFKDPEAGLPAYYLEVDKASVGDE